MFKIKEATVAAGLIILALLFSGCSKEESVDENVSVQEQDLHPFTESIEWDDMTLEAITPVCYYESSDSVLKIFPYKNNESHITVKVIFISENGFWDSVTKSFKGTNNIKESEKYSLVTDKSGATHGYMQRDEGSAYLVESTDLPSSYVELVLDLLCNSVI